VFSKYPIMPAGQRKVQTSFISRFSSSIMLKGDSSSKLCFEEEIVKLMFIINM